MGWKGRRSAAGNVARIPPELPGSRQEAAGPGRPRDFPKCDLARLKIAGPCLGFMGIIELPPIRPVHSRKVMNTPKPEESSAAVFTEDELLQLELKIAQRADKLSQESGSIRGKDLEHWLRAEREIFEGCLGSALAKA
jgi:hypothetical protein